MGATTGLGVVARMRRWRWLPVPVRDIVVTLLVGLAALGLSRVEYGTHGWFSDLVVLLACAPLVLRRRFPAAVALATGSLLFVSFALVDQDGSVIAGVFAVATLAHQRPGAVPVLVPVAVAWWFTYLVVVYPDANSLVEWSGDPFAPAASVIGDGVDFSMAAVPVLVSVLVGYVWRLRADRAEGIRRATRNEFERERLRERERIAREVHDIAGHHLSAIRLLAVGGRQALGGRDPEAVAVLESVAQMSGRAVREVRELLDSLHGDRLTGSASGMGPADLPPLVAALENTGVHVELMMPEGIGEGLPERVGVDVYRIVQESLGNVLRHSSARRVRVELSRTANTLTVTVEDDGRRVTGDKGSGGRGLAGMRDRVGELGGVLDTGSGPGRGWRVRAVLPVRGDE
ncbi:histidine kinase [Nocardiopsis sp. NPDC006832]|uniref:sensor histidine kinase n=1 Tax=Nocardiopsis sp. NPDC006832 TaxID=3157188 RepID=UPI003408AD7A